MNEDAELLAGLNELLAAFEEKDPILGPAVTRIVRANAESGRMATIAANDAAFTLAGYVDRVMRCYQEWHEEIHLLQMGDEATWLPLYEMMQKWAYRLLERRHFLPGRGTELYEHAITCASDAALVLLEKPFPYDVHYQQWAYRVLSYVCIRHMTNEIKAMQGASSDRLVELDAWEDWLQDIADPGRELSDLVADKQTLLWAIDHLASDARKQFILLHYFEGKSFAEIAPIMGRKVNTLYKLHFDALDDLRRNLAIPDNV